jgi:uncharacterized protein (DUF488 family)
MPRHKLFTTGYSGHDLNSFLEVLQSHRIAVVVDVRRNPVSRKKGFSRNALSEFLESNEVKYVHVRELGVPQPLRNQFRDGDCDLIEYLSDFRDYVRRESKALDEVYKLAIAQKCCLLCVEECSDECHRSVVACEVAARNGRTVEIKHI